MKSHTERFGMKTAHAVLVVAGVGAARLVQAGQHNRQRNVLGAGQVHQAYLEILTSDSTLLEISVSPEEGLTLEDHRALVHANRLICILAIKFRLGLLSEETLRIQARKIMERKWFRTYWARYGGFREFEAQDRIDRRFTAVFSDEFSVYPEDEAVREESAA
ncbi:DUF6082 family protein [Streptomyces seoulensis]